MESPCKPSNSRKRRRAGINSRKLNLAGRVAEKSGRDLPGLGQFYSSKEVMAFLGYSDSTSFFQAVRRIGLPYIRITRSRTVFRAGDVERWLEARTVGASARQGGAQ